LLARDKEGPGNGAPARGRIDLVLAIEDGDEVEMALPGAYRLSAEMRRAIKAIPGMVVEDC
jgi:DNA polymerase-3 subunit alpha